MFAKMKSRAKISFYLIIYVSRYVKTIVPHKFRLLFIYSQNQLFRLLWGKSLIYWFKGLFNLGACSAVSQPLHVQDVCFVS